MHLLGLGLSRTIILVPQLWAGTFCSRPAAHALTAESIVRLVLLGPEMPSGGSGWLLGEPKLLPIMVTLVTLSKMVLR